MGAAAPNRSRSRVAGVLLLLALCAAGALDPALAQTTTASLTGTVRLADGTPAAGAVVEARAEETGVTRTGVTDVAGRYRIDLMPPGSWTIVARRGGERITDARTVVLRLQQTVVLNIVAGDLLTEQVTVNADLPLVDRHRVGSELRVDESQVDDLPLSGRLFTDLALLDSAVTAAPSANFFGERGSVFLLNGQSGRANSFLVDGLDNNDMTSNTSPNSFLSQQTIGELVVLTSQYAPEFGRASGGVLNVVTRRGGNEPEGGGFFQGTTARWNPPGDFVASLPDEDGLDDASSRYQAGFHYGGPIARDRAAWFAAYEHQQTDTITPFTGIARNGLAGGWVVSPSRDDSLFVRTDVNLTPSQLFMARLSVDDRRTEDLNVGAAVTPEAGFSLDERDLQIASSLTSILSARTMNEVRILLGRSTFDQLANSDRPGVERPGGTFGGNNLNRQDREETRLQIVDNVTWQIGDHTLKAGVDLLVGRTRADTRFNPSGNFIYDTDDPFEPGDCGDLLASMVDPNRPKDPIDCPGQVGVDDDGDGIVDEPGFIYTYPFVYQLIEGQPTARLNDTRLGLFVQDSFEMMPSLLLTYGLRYDISTFRLPRDAQVDSIIPNGGAKRDADNVAPRIGFAWSPGREGRTVVRGGAGIFYDKIPLGFPAVAAVTSGTEIGLLFPRGLTFELTEDVVEQIGIKTLRPGLFFLPNLTLKFSTGTRLDTPFSEQYSLGLERAAGAHGAWHATVTRSLGYNQVLLRDLNPVVATDAQGIPIHRDPDVGSIASIVTEGRSWYTGLTAGWKWRSGAAWYSASWTWSKSLDLGPDPLKGGISLPPDSDDLAGERGRSDGDRRHRFVVSGAMPLPWLGLRIAGVAQVASGLPFNVTTGRDENLDGILSDRPKGIGRNTGERSDLGAINAMRRQEGLSPIRSLSEPVFAQIDLRVARPFTWRGEDGRGEVFVQMFNLFDRFNPGPSQGAVLSPRFGEPLGLAGPPRIFEAGLKLGF